MREPTKTMNGFAVPIFLAMLTIVTATLMTQQRQLQVNRDKEQLFLAQELIWLWHCALVDYYVEHERWPIRLADAEIYFQRPADYRQGVYGYRTGNDYRLEFTSIRSAIQTKLLSNMPAVSKQQNAVTLTLSRSKIIARYLAP